MQLNNNYENPVYDPKAYWEARDLVIDARKHIDDIPNPIKKQVLGIAQILAEEIITAGTAHSNPSVLDSIPKEYQNQAYLIFLMVTQGTLEAYNAIHKPEKDPKKISSIGSPNDWETDKKGLQDLVNLFKQ